MCVCFFVSDLHGNRQRFDALYQEILTNKPDILFMGGDIYPNIFKSMGDYKDGFFLSYFLEFFRNLKKEMGSYYPKVFIILGNDDPKTEEIFFTEIERKEGLWEYIHNKRTDYGKYKIFGYSNIPPTPFTYKDWELYDVSRYVDPGCIHPNEGKRFFDPGFDIEFTTIKSQLESLTKDEDLKNAIFLFHSPPYKTSLDRAALDNMYFDHVPLDVHVGSIAILDMIIEKQPKICLHGHIHESSRLTGLWMEKINNTYAFTAAYDENKLSLIIFDPEKPSEAIRKII